MLCCDNYLFVFFFKQKTAYEMRISDWSSDVCSSDLIAERRGHPPSEQSAYGRRTGGHAFPEETMIPCLRGIVEQAGRFAIHAFADDVFENLNRFSLFIQQAIDVLDIFRVMLAMM